MERYCEGHEKGSKGSETKDKTSKAFLTSDWTFNFQILFFL